MASVGKTAGMLDRLQTVDRAFRAGKVLSGAQKLPDPFVIAGEAKCKKCCCRQDREKTQADHGSQISAASTLCELEHVQVYRFGHEGYAHEFTIDISVIGVESRCGPDEVRQVNRFTTEPHAMLADNCKERSYAGPD